MVEAPDLTSLQFHLATPVYRYHQHQGETNDCGPTCLAMAANARLGEARFLGAAVAQEMNRWRPSARPKLQMTPPRIRRWATFPWGIVQYLRDHGIAARWAVGGTLERLRRNLLDDRITLVIIGEPLRWRKGRYDGWSHFKIVFGYTPGEGLLFVDPAQTRLPDPPTFWKQNGLSWQDEASFLRQWRQMGRLYIEVD
ncbi:MAG TPA: C39 family peptidase [Anaerolineae bacterium]|nr:C39 family peptidase [Anaerolineae bacterium]